MWCYSINVQTTAEGEHRIYEKVYAYVSGIFNLSVIIQYISCGLFWTKSWVYTAHTTWLFYNLVDSAPTLTLMVLYSFLLRATRHKTRQKTILRLYSNHKRKSHRMALGRVRIFWMRSVFRFSSIHSCWLVLRMRYKWAFKESEINTKSSRLGLFRAARRTCYMIKASKIQLPFDSQVRLKQIGNDPHQKTMLIK